MSKLNSTGLSNDRATPEYRATPESAPGGWSNLVKASFKAEMKLRGHTYKTLSRALAGMGINESDASIANRISRGTFSAAKLLQYLTAMGTRQFQVTP